MWINVVNSIRSLSKAGHSVSIAVPVNNKKSQSLKNAWYYPKSLKNITYISHPESKFDEFKTDLIELVKKEKYDTVLPYGFQTTIAISNIKNEICKYTNVAIADFELIQLLHNKEKLNKYLYDNGFDVPICYDYKDINIPPTQEFKYPLVIKARKGCGVEKGVRYAQNFDEVKNFINEIENNKSNNLTISDYSKPMIQEYIPGKIYDGCFLCDNGEVIASLCQKRETTYPLSGGVGVNVITIEDESLLKYCSEILKFLKWHGPCQVEVKKDSRTGKFKLIEINPKLWGTVGLSIKAGIDFPLKVCELAMGKKEYQFKYKTGLKYKLLFPFEIYTIYQDKGNRFFRALKLLEVFLPNVVTDISFLDIKPNLYYLQMTYNVLKDKKKRETQILAKGLEFE